MVRAGVLSLMTLRPILLVAVLALTACAAAPGATQRSLTIADAQVEGPAVPVEQAPGASDVPIRVSGALFVDADDGVRLCGAVAESFPPQCGGERLVVHGLDLASVELQEANGVRWAEGVELVGTIS